MVNSVAWSEKYNDLFLEQMKLSTNAVLISYFRKQIEYFGASIPQDTEETVEGNDLKHRFGYICGLSQ